MLKSSRNHPSSASLEKLSSMKLAPGAKKAGTAALTQAHSWAPSKRFHSTLSTYNRNHRKRKVMRWDTVSANDGTDRGVISKLNKQPEQQQQNPPTAQITKQELPEAKLFGTYQRLGGKKRGKSYFSNTIIKEKSHQPQFLPHGKTQSQPVRRPPGLGAGLGAGLGPAVPFYLSPMSNTSLETRAPSAP